ncbi:galactan 5-O-arabinofuranosyltransferase [Corynebacterium lubricantis]|uniref:galactan 5-O-arabinofuranosyltransferase n=1 Tax=Corynebacterium lubricantis TaxID=541095 RepID=UPI0009FE4E7D|nr:galactan 5-O-arabinofuranosyltransferase [Corynebacterium lubricantis]
MTVSPTGSSPSPTNAPPSTPTNTPTYTSAERTPDSVSTGRTIASVVVYGVLGGVLALGAWFVLHSISLPAFSTSNVTRALTTAASLFILIAVVAVVLLWLRARKRGDTRATWRKIASEAVCYLAPSALVVTTLGIPLSATKLYLDGIQVDQGFRTQFLTRMTDTFANQDMNYIDLPTYYPIGWFWLGGRMANALNMPGWEVYQPWALVSMAAAAACLGPIWRKLVGSLPLATGISLVTICIVLTMTPDEPYAAVVALFVPAIIVLTQRALHGSWPATIAIMIYLGVSASFYTLFTGTVALAVVVLAFVAAFSSTVKNRWIPIRQLMVMGFGAIAIALVAWGPYVMAVLSGAPMGASTAQHFLPEEGTMFPIPFLSFSIIGLLCLFGFLYMLFRFNNPEVRVLAIATGVFYVWALLSMLATVLGTTLLGFRVETLIVLIMSTTGVLALAELRYRGPEYFYPGRFGDQTNRRITVAFIAILALGGLVYVQQIPGENESHIDQAYQDTDGYGERADRYAPDPGRYYAQIDELIRDYGYVPNDTVVLTDEINFMAYRPYHGFNAFTSHYANPLGEFDARNETIANWAQASYANEGDPEAFKEELDAAPWRSPDVFIFRGTLDTTTENSTEPAPGWKTHIAEDIYPSQPNVRYEGLIFNPEVFDSADWDSTQIGPFVVVARIK